MLQRITLFLLICMVLSDWYIYAAYIHHLTRRWWLRLLYFLPSLVLLVTLVILVTHEDYSGRQTHLTGLFVIVYMAFVLPLLSPWQSIPTVMETRSYSWYSLRFVCRSVQHGNGTLRHYLRMASL